jgi:branched-chain amino acid transport system permease protein
VNTKSLKTTGSMSVVRAPVSEWMRRATWVDAFMAILRIALLGLVTWGIGGSLLRQHYTFTDVVSVAVFGLSIGGIYALIALGYSMVYGILRMVNFAHGDIFMLGSFAAYAAADIALKNGGLWLAAPIAIIVPVAVSCLVAVAVERIAYRPFRHVRSLAPLICGIGISFILQYSVRGAFGTRGRAFPDLAAFSGNIVLMDGVSVPKVQLAVFTAAVIVMAALYVIVMRTSLGKAIRAVAEDRDAATLMGIDVDKIITITFALGGAIAGIAGLLYALVFKQIFFFMGLTLGVKGFCAAVIGGVGNIPGAMIGGLLLGLIEALGPLFLLDGFGVPSPYQLRDVIAYSLLLVVLIFRPRGLFGERMAVKRA